MDELKDAVKAVIANDLQSCDLKISLFSAALFSYRHDSCLKPYPKLKNNIGSNLNHRDVVELFKSLPCLKSLIEEDTTRVDDDLWQFLYWILKDSAVELKTCDVKTTAKFISSETGHQSIGIVPTHIFEVNYKSQINTLFNQRKDVNGCKLGFHGSRLDNYHSIIHNGLQVHLMKNGFFGDGIYLSEDLAVSMPYTNSGLGWTQSTIGDNLSVVAVCEALNHPGVKYKVDNPVDGNEKRKCRAQNSEGGDVPDRYLVVTSSDLVCVKYLYVFAEKKSKAVKSGSIFDVFKANPVMTLLGFYVLFLLVMGLWRSPHVQQMYKRHFIKRFLTDH